MKINKVKSKKCKFCGTYFIPKNSLQKVCSIPCSYEMAKKETKKKEKIFLKELKEKAKSYKQKVNEVKVIFQKWIRKRDNNFGCICCNNKEYTSWDAGHYFKAELYSGVIFDEVNVNKQAVYCNQWKNGNIENYRIGLINKYSEQAVLELEQRAIETKNKRWSDEELKEIKNKYKKLLK